LCLQGDAQRHRTKPCVQRVGALAVSLPALGTRGELADLLGKPPDHSHGIHECIDWTNSDECVNSVSEVLDF
jgi:hypothetical protein